MTAGVPPTSAPFVQISLAVEEGGEVTEDVAVTRVLQVEQPAQSRSGGRAGNGMLDAPGGECFCPIFSGHSYDAFPLHLERDAEIIDDRFLDVVEEVGLRIPHHCRRRHIKSCPEGHARKPGS